MDKLASIKVRQSALISLSLALRHKGVRLSAKELQQHFHTDETNNLEIERALQEVQIKARTIALIPKQLESVPLPAIIQFVSGEYAMLTQVLDDEVQIHRFQSDRAEALSMEDFLSSVVPEILMVAVDEEAVEFEQQEFGFGWFFKTLFKYKSVMREALLGSFFVQLFALITPIFFMIIIDKVFSHNNLSTLDVLVFAMIVVAIFDVILSGVRAYLMSHTTNRVDLELGSKLFKHMMKLPLSYFESRRSGDTIARMREVESIRHFLTGSTLTLLIDLLFLFVFLFVMFLFSKTLFLIVLVCLPLFFLVSFFITPMMKDKLEDKHQKMAENQSFLVETLGGIETVKSSAVEAQTQREYENRLSALAKCSFNSSNLSNFINQGTSLISKVLTIVLLYIGAKLVIAGDLSVGQLIAFNMLTARVIQPIQRLAQIWQEFTSMKVSVK